MSGEGRKGPDAAVTWSLPNVAELLPGPAYAPVPRPRHRVIKIPRHIAITFTALAASRYVRMGYTQERHLT